jgi:hypothetical protein
MRKADKDLLIATINKKKEKGHEVIKLHTRSHGDTVIRVECNCGEQHPIRRNSEVYWEVNLEVKPPYHPNKVDRLGSLGEDCNNF